MIVIPAIDLRDGRCVRLLQGDFAHETIYGDDPVAMARRWQEAGAAILHIQHRRAFVTAGRKLFCWL